MKNGTAGGQKYSADKFEQQQFWKTLVEYCSTSAVVKTASKQQWLLSARIKRKGQW